MHHGTCLIVALLTVLCSCAQSKPPAKPPRPVLIAGSEETRTTTATITAIDKLVRTITFRPERGPEETVTFGTSLKSYDLFRVGQTVQMSVVDRLEVFKKTSRQDPDSKVNKTVADSAPGGPPGVVATETVDALANIGSLSRGQKKLTLFNLFGRDRIVPISEDADPSAVNSGDAVIVRCTRIATITAAGG